MMRCGFLSSETVKSDSLRPLTTAPVFLSRTTTLVSTVSAFTLRVSTVVCFATAICAMAGTGSPAGETTIPATKIAAIARRIADPPQLLSADE